MSDYKPVLSEKPDALDGALDWINREIEKEIKQKQDAELVKDRIAPYRQEAIRRLQEKKKTVLV